MPASCCRPIVFLSSPTFTSLECPMRKFKGPNGLISLNQTLSPLTLLFCWEQLHLPSCLDRNLGVILDFLFPHTPHSIHKETLLALVLKCIWNPDSSCFLLPSHHRPTVTSFYTTIFKSLPASTWVFSTFPEFIFNRTYRGTLTT